MSIRFVCFVATLVLAFGVVAAAATVTVKPGAQGETPLADAVAQLENGDKLVIKKGTYPERLVMSSLDDIVIVGKGKPRIGDGGAMPQIQIVNCTNVVLSKVVVVEGEGHGVLISASPGCTVTKCTVESPAQAGVRVQMSDDVVVEKTKVGGTAAGAGSHIGIDGSESDRLIVTKCRLEAGLDDGVSVVVGEDVTVVKNRFRGILDRGVFFQALRFICDRNRFTDCEGGVRSSTGDSTGAVVSKNRMKGIGQSGGVRIFSVQVTVTRNNIKDSDGLGIGNTFLATGIDISDNKITDARLGGIVNNASMSTVTGNRVNKATGQGIAARGTDALYENNVIKKTTGEGFLLTQGGNTLRGNKVSGSTIVDLQSNPAEGSNTFEDNKFGTTSFP